MSVVKLAASVGDYGVVSLEESSRAPFNSVQCVNAIVLSLLPIFKIWLRGGPRVDA